MYPSRNPVPVGFPLSLFSHSPTVKGFPPAWTLKLLLVGDHPVTLGGDQSPPPSHFCRVVSEFSLVGFKESAASLPDLYFFFSHTAPKVFPGEPFFFGVSPLPLAPWASLRASPRFQGLAAAPVPELGGAPARGPKIASRRAHRSNFWG